MESFPCQGVMLLEDFCQCHDSDGIHLYFTKYFHRDYHRLRNLEYLEKHGETHRRAISA